MTALALADLGPVTATVDDATPFPSVVLTGAGLRFVAFHSAAPVPDIVDWWRADLAHVTRWCTPGTPTIVAGDFNATLDHSAFRAGSAGCTNAAEQVGAGLAGTWPSSQPRWLGSQIDHVLTTGGITADAVTVRDVEGTDHRGVLAHLRLP